MYNFVSKGVWNFWEEWVNKTFKVPPLYRVGG